MDFIFIVMIILTIDCFTFFNGENKYREHINFKHYMQCLKMPIYQKILFIKIAVVLFIVTLFKIIF